MNEPTKRLVLDPSKKGNRENALGAVSMEFENSMVRAALILFVSFHCGNSCFFLVLITKGQVSGGHRAGACGLVQSQVREHR